MILKKGNIVLFLVFLLFSNKAFLQGNQKTIRFSGNEKILKEALQTITKQTGYAFSYNSKKISPFQPIKVKRERFYSMEGALQILFPDSIQFTYLKGIIILKVPEKKRASVEANLHVSTQLNFPKTTPQYNKTDLFTELASTLTSAQEEPLIEIPDSILEKKTTWNSGDSNVICHTEAWNQKQEIMNTQTASLLLGLSGILIAPEIKAQESEQETPTEPIQVSFIYPMGTAGSTSPKNAYAISINLLSGITGKTTRLGLAGISNTNVDGMTGVEIAGITNVGAQDVTGVQIAGICNIAGENSHSKLQMASITNISAENSDVQIAGICNITGENSHPKLQMAGISNISAENSDVQIAGIGNISKRSAAAQISGIYNIAQKSRFQLGLVNVIQDKGGFQLGFINIRDSADSPMLGLINIVGKGRLMELELATSESYITSISFRSGTPRLYGILSLGYSYILQYTQYADGVAVVTGNYDGDRNNNRFGVGIGIGTRISFNSKIGLNFEFMYINHLFKKSIVYSNRSNSGKFSDLSSILFHALFEYSPMDKFSLFGGPSVNFRRMFNSDKSHTMTNENGTFHIEETVFPRTIIGCFGASVGIRFKF